MGHLNLVSTTTPSHPTGRHRSKTKYEYLIAKCDDLYVSSNWLWEKIFVGYIHMYSMGAGWPCKSDQIIQFIQK